MKTANFREVMAEIEFAKKAAAFFSTSASARSFAEDDPAPGNLLALRWGMDLDCVLVVRLDEIHTPTIYPQLVRSREDQRTPLRVITITESGDASGFNVEENGRHCDGMGWDEMLAQVVSLTLPKRIRESNREGPYRMQTSEEWAAERDAAEARRAAAKNNLGA